MTPINQGEGTVRPCVSVATSPGSIKNSDHLSPLADTLMSCHPPPQIHLTQNPHTKHPLSWLYLWKCVLPVFSPYYMVSPLIHHVDSRDTQNHLTLPQKESQQMGNSLFPWGLLHHTERPLVQAYCTDNQNSPSNAAIT